MTLNEIKESDKVFLTPQDVCKIVHCNAQYIRQAKPEDLGFPITRVGKVTKIPRKQFLKYLCEE